MRPRHGPRLTSGGAVFSVFAPKLGRLSLRHGGVDRPMRRRDGFFELELKGASPGDRYAFVLPSGQVRPDPATRRQPAGVHEASQLFDPSAYRWRTEGWRGLRLDELVLYELHVGTFTDAGTLDAAAERLGDLVELGVTCVELMPVQPFPGSRNWGYDGVAPYAVHEAYGGPEALLRFVDAAHAAGIAVCLDVVYNHLGPEGNYTRDFGPYFNSRHKSPWGDGLDFDGEGAGPVRRFMIDAALQWVREFRADALRLDAVHAIADSSPTHLAAELAGDVEEVAREQGRQIHVIAESDLNDRKLVEPRPGGWGLSAVWADDLHHALHALLTGERQRFYRDYGSPAEVARALAEGFVLQGQYSSFRGRPHGTRTAGLAPCRFVVCTQNHDQIGNRPRGERLPSLVPWDALPPVAALVALGSGLPMIFMGEEYGETNPFLYFTSHSDPALAKAVSEGRRSEFIAAGGKGDAPDPQDPRTFLASKPTHRRDGRHGELRDFYRALFATRRRHLASISEQWPEVRVRGSAFELRRPGLTVEVNLGPSPQAGLGPWGHRITER